MPLSKKTRTILIALIPIAAVASAIAVMSIPPDARLGSLVRLAMFHGASTWVNMGTFMLAGLAGIAFVGGMKWALPWGQSLRWVSLGLWVVNTVLGILSMQLNWGGILWNEPRLLMTFGILAGALIVVAMQFMFESPKIPALLDLVLAAALWYLVFVLPDLFHPDNPVFASENLAYRNGFFGMVGSIGVLVGSVVTLVARRTRRDPEDESAAAV